MTRIAVIADIHGNADALRAVLVRIDAMDVDRIVNLGDLFSGPLAAGETADILMGRTDILSIRGNHDRYLLTQPVDKMRLSDRAAYEELTDEALRWLETLPTGERFDGISLCHGTPQNDDQYWLHDVTATGDVIARDHDAIAAWAGEDPLHLCAHTHLPGAVRLSDGRLIANPGSVGCPAYTDDNPVPHVVCSGFPDASFLVVENVGGIWVPTFFRVPYDASRMAARAALKNRHDWAEAVATGWITT